MVGGSGGDDDEGRCKPMNTCHSILLPYQNVKAKEGYEKEYGKGASEMTQWSRSLAALVKVPASVPETASSFTIASNFSSRKSDDIYDLYQSLHTCDTHKLMQLGTHTHTNNKYIIKMIQEEFFVSISAQ